MKKLQSEKGFALAMVSIFALMSSMLAGTFMALSVNESKNVQRQVHQTDALYLAEAGLERARWELKALEENGAALPSVEYSITDFNVNSHLPTNLQNYAGVNNPTITIEPLIVGDLFRVHVTATVGDSSKTLHAVYRHYPPAHVFDYAYFVNNWGWLHGGPITINGDMRSNGSVSIKYGPTVEGKIYAADTINIDGHGINGSAGDQDENGEYINQFEDQETLPMPNLHDLTWYENLALSTNASISVGGVVLVDGVYGDDAGEEQNLVLVGTVADPIVITGANVIRGDVVIKGVVTGQGTVYSGRNLYVADQISYADGPSTPQPASSSYADIDAWYAAEKDKDIVGFAARESIILGNFTNQGQWAAQGHLFDMGEEDSGKDGIPDTDDEFEDDNTFQPVFEDLDEDGIQDHEYGWPEVGFGDTFNSTNFGNFPAGVSQYGDMASNSMTNLDGIYYTNHAFAGRGGGMTFNGSIISKDESLYISSIVVNYDWRIHSRFTAADPNWLIALGLPAAKAWGLEDWEEEAYS